MLLPSLHPVSVHLEGTGVDQAPHMSVVVGDGSHDLQRNHLGGLATHVLESIATPDAIYCCLKVRKSDDVCRISA